MLSIRNLSKDWSNFSLKNINLDIENREYFIVLGPTGAGKTLLLELIAGFHRPDSGKILLDSDDVTFLPPEERRMGFVYQDYSLFPHFTVEENVKFGLEFMNLPQSEVGEKVKQILWLLDLQRLINRYPHTLSGGEKQRTALARALVLDPKVLLLDEPISSLDAPSQETLRGELKRIQRELEVTTIHVTHNREEASLLGDRIGIMSGGRIIQVGEAGQIFRKPKTKFIAEFVGAENIFEGKSSVEEGVARIDIGGGVEIAAVGKKNGKVKAIIRPEEIIISKGPIQTSGRNLLEGVILKIRDLGATVKLMVDVGRVFKVTITKKSLLDMDLKIGSRVYLAFKASAVHII